MGKRKPKLCRMNRLVFPKNHIFLFTEDEPIYTLPFSFHFPFELSAVISKCDFVISDTIF